MPSKMRLHLARFPRSPAPMPPPPPSPTGPCTCLLALLIRLCNHLVYLRDSSSKARTFVCETSALYSACHVTLAKQILRRCLMNGTWAEKRARKRLIQHLTMKTQNSTALELGLTRRREGCLLFLLLISERWSYFLSRAR